MGALVGKLFKKHENESSESLKIPAKLSFLKDITVSTAIIMTLLYLVGVTAAGPAWVQENVSGGTAAYMYAISQGVMFGVGITIVLTGVSMMIAEITEAFKGDNPPASLLFDPYFEKIIGESQDAWRRVIVRAVEAGIPTPVFSSSLAYYDGLRSKRLPTALTPVPA